MIPQQDMTIKPRSFCPSVSWRVGDVFYLLFVALGGLLALQFYFDSTPQGLPWVYLSGAIAAIVFVAYFLVAQLLYPVLWRVDEKGIHYHSRWRSHTIPWQAFADGQVWRKHSQYEFDYLAADGDGVKVPLHMLSDSDKDYILSLITAVWVAPRIHTCVENLALEFAGNAFSRRLGQRVELNTAGLFLGKKRIHIPWADIDSVVVVRGWSGHQGFVTMRVTSGRKQFCLTGRYLVNIFENNQSNFRGAEPYEVLAFIESKVSTERFQYVVIDRIPESSLAQRLQRRYLRDKLLDAAGYSGVLLVAPILLALSCDCATRSLQLLEELPLGIRSSILSLAMLITLGLGFQGGNAAWQAVSIWQRYRRLGLERFD